ncbi:MAG: hypothetical protein D6722_17525 [Bacteroidetes bacterium]|nr:MAG: hypothetical protein D6722_17525 [Bacteroidota bacterium]
MGGLSLVDPITLRVEVSWEGSWALPADTAPGNHDAVWLFAKYLDPLGVWAHLPLRADSGAHAVLSGNLRVQAARDGRGLMLSRAQPGNGPAGPALVEVHLDMPLGPASVRVQVMGIEMVWVPEGAFWVGDSSSYYRLQAGDTGAPWRIASEDSLPVGPQQLWSDSTYRPAGDLPAAFPKGYAGFYLMKYELGQAQYAAFLSSLSPDGQAARTAIPPQSPVGTLALMPAGFPAFRNGVAVASPAQFGEPARYGCDADGDGLINGPADGQNRACNFLSWGDLLAYLDWAGLRPMTELEFEKACRGPALPLPGEFAWGTAQAVDANTPLQDGTAAETVAEIATATAGLASHGYQGPQGPLRAGFGANAASGRLQAGAGYYGARELSGNLWEMVVPLDSSGLAFRGTHGDGMLTYAGEADVPDWPLAGGGYRGGGWNSGIVGAFRDLAVSDRFYIYLAPAQRRNTSGGRGARSGHTLW